MSWPSVKVRDIATANYGKALKKEHRDETGSFDVFGSSGKVGQHSEPLVNKPTLVIGRKGSVGEVIWAPNGGWVIDTAYFLELNDPEVIDLRYLFYALKRANLAKRTITTSIPGLNRDDFYDVEIPLPPLTEQKRIAAILDKADTIRRKRQQAIQLADDFLRAVFLDMFGDPKDCLTVKEMLEKDYLLLHKDGNHGSNYPRKDEFLDRGIPFISAKDISDSDGSVNFESIAYLSEEKARKLTIGWLKKGDVLLAHNATVGRVGIFDGQVPEALIGTSLTAFRPNPSKISSSYLFAALKYSNFQAQLRQNMGQSTRNQVPITAQKELKIPIGDRAKQRTLEEIYMKSVEYRHDISSRCFEVDKLFNSLSQRAFSGKL